ncbi:MAG: endonuclease/exonuclease/phosphatase family protein [Gammaproteobacteria bacterium]|nr:endonuclease/exonuclease/phosphatase family protein [Gammaproteobacteria bacterium]MDH3768114.1 endonuclease/exonuclease/phosphatase family protein [Gammaproteobacteria bacterium]
MKRLGVISAMALLLLPAIVSSVEPADEVRVLTRNIYVGADIFRVIEAPDAISALLEIAAVYQTVLDTDFAARAEALADEILETSPHLIGLQEVSLLRRQSPGDALAGNPVPAVDVELDFLQILLDAMVSRGLTYEVAAVIENADVELPLLGPVLDDIRLTDRDVILVRNDVVISNPLTRTYDNFVSVNLSGLDIQFKRGLLAVDAQVSGRTYRFVNTHLETGGDFGGAVQALQAPELIDALADEYLPVILLGDFNASPDAAPELAYAQLIDAGFVDTWLQFAPADPGFTCCHIETLNNPLPELSSRIDIVFVRNAATPAAIVIHSEVVGDEIGDQTPGGLWPSDHAGVFATLNIPVGDNDGDGLDDLSDNCITVENTDQRDTDFDGFGNICDPDFNQDQLVNFADLAYMGAHFFTDDPDADLNGDGRANFRDLAIMANLFFRPPGPSALAQ